jgi:predicted phage tail protein
MIKLYGALAKKFGHELDIVVNSVSEMMKALEANRPGFKTNIDKDRKYVIRRGDSFKLGVDVPEEELKMNFSETTWHVLPLPLGYGGVARFVLGAVLFVVGAVLSAYGLGAFGVPLMNIGVGLMIGGVAAMLAPSPDANNYADRESPDKKPSYLFNGPFNRTASGGAVPVVYGKDVFIGSTFVSGGLTIGDLS